MAGYGPGKFVFAPILLAVALSLILLAIGLHLRRTGKLSSTPAKAAWTGLTVLPIFGAAVVLMTS